MDNGGILPTLGSAQDFLPIDSSYTQIDLDTNMEEEDWVSPVKDKQEEGAYEA